MEIESKDPALGTITENKIKVPLDPEDKMIKSNERPRKGNPYKLAIWILSVILVALIALLIFLAFCPISPLKQPCPEVNPDDNNQSTTNCPTCEVSAEDAAVRKVLAELTPVVSEQLKPFRSQGVEFYNVYTDAAIVSTHTANREITVYYRPQDFATAVPLNLAYGIMARTPENMGYQSELYNYFYDNKFYNAIAEKLKSLSFTDTGEAYTLVTGPGAKVFVNDETGVVCNVDYSSVGCGHKGWYDKEQASLANTLAKIYQEDTGKSAELLVAYPQQIKNSSVEPYQNISVTVPGARVLFYRISPEAEWRYFSDVPGVMCSEYNTEDLRKAFAGQECTADNNSGTATVEP